MRYGEIYSAYRERNAIMPREQGVAPRFKEERSISIRACGDGKCTRTNGGDRTWHAGLMLGYAPRAKPIPHTWERLSQELSSDRA